MLTLNVGGTLFQCTRQTLTQSNTFFTGLVETDPSLNASPLFIDRDGTHFRFILNWLRGVRFLPPDDAILSELAYEADYYAMEDMVEAIRARRGTHPPLTRSLFQLSSRPA